MLLGFATQRSFLRTYYRESPPFWLILAKKVFKNYEVFQIALILHQKRHFVNQNEWITFCQGKNCFWLKLA